MQAAERIRLALKDKPRGFRGPKQEQYLIEVYAVDVLACVATASDKTKVISALEKGSSIHAGNEKQKVFIQADDAYELLDKQPTPPAPPAG